MLIYVHNIGLNFGELFSLTCNGYSASSHIYEEALGKFMEEKEIRVVNEDGAFRRNGRNIKNNDQILPPVQRSLFSL